MHQRGRKAIELRRPRWHKDASLRGRDCSALYINRAKAPLHHGAVVNFFLRNKARM